MYHSSCSLQCACGTGSGFFLVFAQSCLSVSMQHFCDSGNDKTCISLSGMPVSCHSVDGRDSFLRSNFYPKGWVLSAWLVAFRVFRSHDHAWLSRRWAGRWHSLLSGSHENIYDWEWKLLQAQRDKSFPPFQAIKPTILVIVFLVFDSRLLYASMDATEDKHQGCLMRPVIAVVMAFCICRSQGPQSRH